MNVSNLDKVIELGEERKILRHAFHCLSSGCELQVYNPNTNMKYKLTDISIVASVNNAIKKRMKDIDETLQGL